MKNSVERQLMTTATYLLLPLGSELLKLGDISGVECKQQINNPLLIRSLDRLENGMGEQLTKVVYAFPCRGVGRI